MWFYRLSYSTIRVLIFFCVERRRGPVVESLSTVGVVPLFIVFFILFVFVLLYKENKVVGKLKDNRKLKLKKKKKRKKKENCCFKT